MLEVLAGKKPDKTKMLRYLTDKVITERQATQQATKTLLKIRRSTDWFLEHTLINDIDITKIDYDQVQEFITADTSRGVAGSTLNGHLYGLGQVWNRAKQSKIVTGENPFSNHRVSKGSVSYDPYTHEEIYKMHDAADEDLKILIHAAATTGARLNELLTAEVIVPSTFNHPCWFFKFKDKGKTAHSTRVIPVHSSLQLPAGFSFRLTDRTVTRKFKEIRDRIIVDGIKEGTGQPRKLSFHSFRTTVISELVGVKEIDREIVGKITGHQSGGGDVGSINSYIQMDDLSKKKRIVEAITWDHVPSRG